MTQKLDAIIIANQKLLCAELPTYDDLLEILRDVRGLLSHHNVPKTRTVQKLDDALAANEPDKLGNYCRSCGHDLNNVNSGCRDCL